MRGLTCFLVAPLVIGLLVACGSGSENEASSTPLSASSTGSPAPTTRGNPEAIEAASTYLQETGIDGIKGTFTDPLNCPDITEDTESEFCLHQAASIFGVGLTILVIGDRENPNERAWEMRLSPAESGWEISNVAPYGTSE
jgi:hypothetical protein